MMAAQTPRKTRQDGNFSLHGIAILLACVFFTLSLTPSLMPRDPTAQGALGGIVALIGHEIGLMLRRLWLFLDLPRTRRGSRRALFWLSVLLGCGILAIGFLNAGAWQNETRAVMGLEPVDTAYLRKIAMVGAAVFVGGWIVLRLVTLLAYYINRGFERVLPRRLGQVLGWGIVLWLVWAVTDGVLLRRALLVADASFEAADELVEPDVPQPTVSTRTGSPESLVDWDEMGRWGRSFVSRTPSIEDIEEFSGPGATEPVRVYVGRRSAETARERAELALQELIRVGGFERANLVVAVPVGTGWMDPGAHDTLDFMLEGDVATVAVQYSYLTSVLSLLVHPEYGVEQARELFDVVYEYWSKLPKDSRPRFLVHGLSQGAFNSQMTLPFVDILGDPIHGGLWAGSPFISPLWQRVRDERQPDSPAWRPVYGNGSLARVMTQAGETYPDAAPWGPIRMVFLHYGSDPIVNFTFPAGVRRPGWFDEPRAPDVSPALRWYPVVTMFQLALDMAVSLNVEGYGHFYIAPDYIDAWAVLVEPDGWNSAQADRLKDIFSRRGPAW